MPFTRVGEFDLRAGKAGRVRAIQARAETVHPDRRPAPREPVAAAPLFPRAETLEAMLPEQIFLNFTLERGSYFFL